jgi:hypothetical protein
MYRLWALVDGAIVLVFVVIGRSVHAHGDRLIGIASTAWPFAAGLLVGWLTVTLRNESALSLRGGLVVTLFTVAVGMILRVLVGQGTAVAFILVALVFLGGAMIGWRLVRIGSSRRHDRSAQN